MGSRRWFELSEKYPYLHFTHLWYKPGSGKFAKGQLHRARRRYIKAVLMGQSHPRQPTHYESECNWKGW